MKAGVTPRRRRRDVARFQLEVHRLSWALSAPERVLLI